MKKLIVFLLLLTIAFAGFGQTDTICFDKKEFQIGLEKKLRGDEAIKINAVLVDEITALRETVREKDSSNAALKKELESTRASLANQMAQNGKRVEIIGLQGDNIRRLGGRVKRWSVGPSVGYGYSLGPKVQRGGFVGVNVQLSIIKF